MLKNNLSENIFGKNQKSETSQILKYMFFSQEDPLERILLCQHLLPTSVISNTQREEDQDGERKETTTKGLHLQMKGKHQKDLRKQLLGIF